ncbi:flagellar hook-length control protein FliK [Kordiimonas pumila]|uniref:Flagellar hook-length control protein FliK n=1 Tax=Kordiimonas pumila TaxID=2161677 RepID=A0ABV7D711_9PROT|nr:flagellar hook-length control protein FliK [Kordiimonas pumila]
MNAIEQFMQNSGANPTQSLSDFYASIAGKVDENGDLASQFTEALKSINPAISASGQVWGVKTPEGVDGIVVVDPSDLLAEATDIADLSGLQTLSPESIDVASIEGIAGLQLIQMSGLELANRIQAGQLQTEPATIASLESSAQNDIFIFAADASTATGEVHLLPLAQLEALTTTPPAPLTNLTDAAPKDMLTVPTLAAVTAPTPDAALSLDTAQNITPESIVSAAAAAKPVNAQQTRGGAELMSVTEAYDVNLDAKAAEAQAVTVNAAQQKAAAQTAPAQQATTDTASQQAAATAQAAQANAAKQATSKTASTDTAKPLTPEAVLGQNNSAVPTLTANPVTEMMAARSSEAARAPVITWTPETISGGGDGSAAEAVSAGLSSLRGDTGFMSSMGLLGGKPSPALGGQIAKQLNLAVSRTLKNGGDQFTMRLDPPELGRVRVSMAFGSDGTVTARVVAERPETLELLQRDTKGLERALEAGGHKVENGSISFSLDSGDGESAGKAFAEAVQDEQHKNGKNSAGGSGADTTDDGGDELDTATLDEILAHVTVETGLDVRV